MLRQKNRNYDNKRLLHKDSDEETEETELLVNKSPYREIPTVEKMIEDGDTLQALSIKYHCTVGELKRLNNIHKDNEIFAKSTIKVPAKLISMALVHTSGSSSPTHTQTKEAAEKVINEQILEEKLIESVVNPPSSLDISNNVNALIFNSSIQSKPCDNNVTSVIEEISDEEVTLLPNVVKEIEPVAFSKLSCNGADADISWKALILCIIILILAVPLIYVFYIAEQSKANHTNKDSHH